MFSRLWHWLTSCFSSTASFVGNAFTGYATIADSFGKIEEDINFLSQNIPAQIDRIKNFKFDPKWSTRVINVPIAIDQIRDLISQIFDDIKGRFLKIIQPVSTFQSAIDSLNQPPPPGNIEENNTALDKTILLVTSTKQMAIDLAAAFDQIKAFDELATRIIDDVENLDDLFLQQKNKRKTVDISYRKRQSA